MFAVDTAFVLSAFLATYHFLEALQKKKLATLYGKKDNFLSWLGLTYLHRYLRLTPLYFVVLMFYTYVMPQVAQGPFWKHTVVW